jgi:hypothetical protein
MTDKYRAGVQSVFKPRTARRPNVGTLRLISEDERPAEYARLPIWMAALLTSGCRATAAGFDCNVQWHSINGKAQYTNHAPSALLIQPLGIRLESGQTLTAFWTPGETNYTFEIVRQHDRCA